MTNPKATDTASKRRARPDGGKTSVADVFGAGLGGLHEPSTKSAGGPGRATELSLDLIDEDPDQPRTSFDPEALQELADTIAERGVKSPISVRPHPAKDGRYMINHGARRYRASRLAGRATIPVYLDTDHTAADQVIENLQRDNLSAREIADFIARELKRGKKKGDIAKSIGKSAAYVSQHVALLDLPDCVARAMAEGRARDVTLIVELARLARIDEQAVCDHIDANEDITRSGVRLLQDFIDARRNPQPEPPAAPSAPKGEEDEEREQPRAKATRWAGYLEVRHDGELGSLRLDIEPSAHGQGFVAFDNGDLKEVALSEVEIVEIRER